MSHPRDTVGVGNRSTAMPTNERNFIHHTHLIPFIRGQRSHRAAEDARNYPFEPKFALEISCEFP